MAYRTFHDAFEAYLDELAPKLGHADRVPSFKAYCHGLMLPLERKSIEPNTASVDPEHIQARHQALHHLVAKAPWRIERDYQKLKQGGGLDHYEGRNWRGFHHPRLSLHRRVWLPGRRTAVSCHRDQKKSRCSRHLPYPKGTGRGIVRRAQRHVSDSITTLRWHLSQGFMTTLHSRWRYL